MLFAELVAETCPVELIVIVEIPVTPIEVADVSDAGAVPSEFVIELAAVLLSDWTVVLVNIAAVN